MLSNSFTARQVVAQRSARLEQEAAAYRQARIARTARRRLADRIRSGEYIPGR
jgi:hypothetical protein